MPGQHVMVFVHGLHGDRRDLSLVQAHVLMMDPTIKCCSSSANEVKLTNCSCCHMAKSDMVYAWQFSIDAGSNASWLCIWQIDLVLNNTYRQ